MGAKLLRVEFKGLNSFKNEELKLDLTTDRKVFETAIENNHVKHLFSSIYTPNIIGIVGINASGKTTVLKLLEMIFYIYIYRAGLNEYFTKNGSISDDNWLYSMIDEKLEINAYFYIENKVLRVYSEILKENGPEKKLIFGEEEIVIKKVNDRTAKKDIYNFEDNKYIFLSRSDFIEKDKFMILKDDSSIFNPYIFITEEKEKVNSRNYIVSLLSLTNMNILFGDAIMKTPLSLIKYLDNNIEKLDVIDKNKLNMSDKSNNIVLKFKNKEEMKIGTGDLSEYLSSGTIKGINILIRVMNVLENGGYIIIDEIENHLNKNIVLNIIDLFVSPLNKKGATLIMSTHYTEIVDMIPRDDAVYVMIKDELIECTRLFELIKNDDLYNKKSEIILGGKFATTPDYKSYKNFYYDLKDRIENKEGVRN